MPENLGKKGTDMDVLKVLSPKISFAGKTCWIGILCHLVMLAALHSPAYSQDNSLGGGPTIRNQVPTLEARPALSPLERRNLTTRGEDLESISDLLKNVNDADAMLEVVVGRSRVLTLQEPLAVEDAGGIPVVAVGDPSILEFDILPSSQMIRILGRRVGSTDLSVITATGKVFSFEIQVVYDMNYLRAYLKQLFPNANLKVAQMYEHVVLEGEASSTQQVAQIVQVVQTYMNAAQFSKQVRATQSGRGGIPPMIPEGGREADEEATGGDPSDAGLDPLMIAGRDDKPSATADLQAPQVINLIRVPGVQQVMLQVKIAEVNRTALRRIGTDFQYRDSSGRTFGAGLGGNNPLAGDAGQLLGLTLGGQSTSYAILPNTALSMAFEALRENSVLNILAEPNLMAMHGQKASFLAGGEFPVPVPQNIGGANTTFTVQFKEFGVLLDFIPYIMDDGSIRLQVAPEVSTIDPAVGVSTAGITIPGVNTRRANTTVELKQGQTLALAGLIQVEMDANTRRIPGMGDLPYIGSFFGNSTHQRVEKELIILVAPYLVDALEPEQVPPLPGSEILDPDDREFYALNRIESRFPESNYRAVNGWDDPLNIQQSKLNGFRRMTLPRRLHGPFGFSQ